MEMDDNIRGTYVSSDVTYRETCSPRYHDRTVINASWADLTVAFATDFGTAGERLTRKAAGDRYLPVNLPSSAELCHDRDTIRKAADFISRRMEGRDAFRLNVAGNGLETLLKSGISQSDADHFVTSVLGEAMALGMKVSEIRSGGQSGIDESGIKAALAYGIPAGITFPRGWLYNDAQGHPHWNKVAFMQRFDGIERIQIPRIEFDVAQALHQDEPAPDVKSYNPGRDSVMLGVIAGDIIASPYFHAEPESPRFELFAPTRRGYGQNAVNIHPSPTNNSSLSLVVGQWLSSDQDHSEAVLRRMVSTLNIDHYTSNNIAAAASVTGLYASNYIEARDLSRTVVRAMGRDPEREKGAEAAAQAVFMASHGRNKNEIAFAMDLDYGYDTSVANAGIHARQMMDEGNSEHDIVKAMLQEHGIVIGKEKGVDADGNRVYTLEEIFPRTRVMEERSAEINGEKISWMEPTSRRDTRSENAVPLALAVFINSFTFEEAVRKATALGGDSPAIASIAGALSAAYYGGIPNDIASRCEILLGSSRMEAMNRFLERDVVRVPKQLPEGFPSIDVHFLHGHGFAVIPSSAKQLCKAAREEDIIIVTRKELADMLSESRNLERATHLDGSYSGRHRMYLTPEGLVDVSRVQQPGMPSLEDRKKASMLFESLKRYCREVRLSLEKGSGFDRPESQMMGGSLHFTSAYYPRVYHDRVDIMEGDLLAGSVILDQGTGLMRIQWDGDYRDGEYRDADWCRERVFDPSRIVTKQSDGGSLSEDFRRTLKAEGIRMDSEEMKSLYRLKGSSSSYTEDLDGIKAAIARFCLDEGVGINDLERKCNRERASEDVLGLCNALSGMLSERSTAAEVSTRQSRSDDLFNALSPFSDGFRVVRKNGEYNLQDRDGRMLLNGWYSEITPFENGFARVRLDDGTWNYVDTTGHALLRNGVDRAASFREGYAPVCKDGKWNYVGTDGCCIGRTWFESASPFVDGKAVVSVGGRSIYIDHDGKLENSDRKSMHKGI